MGPDGGSASTLLRCARDGVETRLQCAECGAPICPKCFVRTDVGLRCQTCGAASGPVVATAEGRRRAPVVVALVAVVALLAAGAAWMVTRSGDSATEEFADIGTGEVVKVDPVTISSGEFANGASWSLVARREGRICLTFTTSTDTRPEQCGRAPGNRALTVVTRRVVTGPGGQAFVTLGIVTEQVERISVSGVGILGSRDVPVIGRDAGLGYRFFVFDDPVNATLSLTAIGANGGQLGRVTLAELRLPPR
jgi:hypothetical protein